MTVRATTDRESRRYTERETSQHRSADPAVAAHETDSESRAWGPEPEEYRVDLERIRFSPYFARLSAVTQVIPQSGVGPVMHNRLTHSLKVSAVARVIAANLAGRQAQHEAYERGEAEYDDRTGAIVSRLGGCDTIVAQAAGHAHDLGHPPFGHLGEQALDRIARHRLGLAEGFEGNAQTLRILTSLDTLGRDFPGLNLTAAVRAAVLKYPWTRGDWRGTLLESVPANERPRGVGIDVAGGAEKFSVYAWELTEFAEARAAFPNIEEGRQTVECAVMDLADDIAYAIHDLDDFARAGVLQRAQVERELGTWLGDDARLAAAALPELERNWRDPGASLELLWRGLAMKDGWMADRDVFRAAVERVHQSLSEELLAAPYDGGIASERAVSGFTRRWIDHLRTSIVVDEHPAVRGGHVRLGEQAWHEVAVLKFVHAHFVLQRPEHAQAQRGMAQVIEGLALGFEAWLTDPDDRGRAPRALLEWAEGATEAAFALERDRPGVLGGDTSEAGLRRQGRARAILDYVATFTDQQAYATHAALTGR